MPQAILSQRIQDFFKGTSSEAPMILLISKKEETINYLTNMGIDTSGWLDGIRDLMMSDVGHNRLRSKFTGANKVINRLKALRHEVGIPADTEATHLLGNLPIRSAET